MKIKYISIIYFGLVALVFSQSPKYDLAILMNSNKIQMGSSNNKIEIVKISALVNYDRFDRMLTSGMQWGGVAIVVGATLETIFNHDDYFKYLMTALGGMIASAGGLAYGTFSSIPKNYNVGKNRFGFQINVGQTMAEGSYRFIGNFGIIFRYPNTSSIVPDNYIIYVGSEDVEEKTTATRYSELHLTKYGVQLRKVGYNRTLNFLYGIDFGQSKGSYSYSTNDDLEYYFSESKNVSSFYFDIIVGANFNFTKNIHGSIEYQYELIGASRKNEVLSIFNSPAHGVTSFSVYTFIF